MKIRYRITLFLVVLMILGCGDDLTETNKNPNGIDPANADLERFLPGILQNSARQYTSWGYGHIAGVMQHMQEDGWFTAYNDYQWTPEDWNNWFSYLRNNDFVLEKAQNSGLVFLEGIATTVKAMIFGTMSDLWGDVPYSEALKATDESEIIFPKFDPQEEVYKGILNEFKKAEELFALGNTSGNPGSADVLLNGNIDKWHRFVNSLILRYSMRLSDKLPDLAQSNIESVYQSGIYIKDHSDDVMRAYSETQPWPTNKAQSTNHSEFLRRKPCQTLIDVLYENKDPRLEVWFAPVHCQWVEDLTLDKPKDEFIRKNGELTDKVSLTHQEYLPEIEAGNVFTRHYNPELLGKYLDTNQYVGVPQQMLEPSVHNDNPTPGQTVQNQHVSQLASIFGERSNSFLQSRLMTAQEVYFILAEAALKGWNVGSAEDHYYEAILQSFKMWGIEDKYDVFIKQPGVKFDGSLKQIIEQKWIASFTHALEAWYDYRRTGFPALETGIGAVQDAVPVRLLYGDNELQLNEDQIRDALDRLEETPYSKAQGKNSQWAKPWLIQGTGKPW